MGDTSDRTIYMFYEEFGEDMWDWYCWKKTVLKI